MTEKTLPVPAVPSVVLALGASLASSLAWLEQRFRFEIGSIYPGNLLRFRLLTGSGQLAPRALRTLCDPLLLHPLWLGLQERGLAPTGERGPQLNVYAILSRDDEPGQRLLAPLHSGLCRLYEGRLVPNFCLFWVGSGPQMLPPLPDLSRPLPCFVLGSVKHLGYGISGRQEPFETIRLALNAMLASSIAGEIEGLLEPDPAPGPVFFALGVSAIAVARPQMETWLQNTLLQRLVQACLQKEESGAQWQARRLETRRQAAALFDLPKVESGDEGPDEIWERALGQHISGLFTHWADQVLAAWGLEARETRSGQWRIAAQAEGNLQRHLQQVLSGAADTQASAQAALSQEIVRLANGLHRHFAQQEDLLRSRWLELLAQAAGEGRGCLARLADIAAAVEAGLSRARDAVQGQRLSPLWLRTGRDITALADILAAQMVPVRSATERARLSFAPPGRVALRLLPLTLLLGAAGADLRPGWQGTAAGLAGGLLFAGLAAGLQYHRARLEERAGMRELKRLYEDAIGGLVLSEAHAVLQRLHETVALSAAQVQAVADELNSIDGETTRVLDELARFPRENTYLERQISDPAHCARIAGEVSVEALLGGTLASDEAPVTLATMLASAVRGDLPAHALGAALIEAVGRIVVRRSSAQIETRVEELLVAGIDRPFLPEATMDALHRRALPLWPAQGQDAREAVLISLSREASMAFQGWLAEHAGTVRILPTLQRDRISYLRCRQLDKELGNNAS